MTLLNHVKPLVIAMALASTAVYTTTAVANEVENNKAQPAFTSKHHGEAPHNMQKMHKKMMRKRFKRMAHQLALTSEQRQQMKDILKNAKADREKYQPMMQAFHQAMQTLLTADTFDEQAILALKDNYKSTFEQLALIKAKSRFDMFAMLTDEQKDKWLAMQQKRHEKRMGEHE